MGKTSNLQLQLDNNKAEAANLNRLESDKDTHHSLSAEMNRWIVQEPKPEREKELKRLEELKLHFVSMASSGPAFSKGDRNLKPGNGRTFFLGLNLKAMRSSMLGIVKSFLI